MSNCHKCQRLHTFMERTAAQVLLVYLMAGAPTWPSRMPTITGSLLKHPTFNLGSGTLRLRLDRPALSSIVWPRGAGRLRER